MNLGIVVVYLVPEEDENFLNLHLKQIQKHTAVPYTIYAGANRLSPKLRTLLQHHSETKICSLAPTDLRGAAEHSHYLEQLVRIAIEDGATYIAILHTDSFPIRDGWAEELASQLSSTLRFAAISRGPYTACLFFPHDFHLTYQPRFLLTAAELSTAQYKLFSKKFDPVSHSGIGYFFKAFCEGFSWHPLIETQKGNALGSIYNDMIFHMHGAARFTNVPSANHLVPSHTARWLARTRMALRSIVPKPTRRWAWKHFGDMIVRGFDQNIFLYAKQQLLENPDAYFDYMRTGKK